MTATASRPFGSACAWDAKAPTRLAVPGPDEVHSWRASLVRPEEQVARLGRSLSADERERAERFHAAPDRRRFLVARGLLRELLGRYLGAPAGAVHFAYGPAGKPELARPGPGAPLRFNVAHSADLAVYAVTSQRRVGVDVEAIRPVRDLSQVARLVFSESEREALRALPPERRERAFFDGWTRKEAMVKALGVGLNDQLRGIRVALGRHEANCLHAIDGDQGASAKWTLVDVDVGAGFSAALAVEGRAGARPPSRPCVPCVLQG